MLVFADGDYPSVGARSAGMSGVSLLSQDQWAVFNNQAGMAGLEKTSMAFYYENRFMLKETGYGAFAFSMPALSGNLGLSVSHFGYTQYNENQIGLAFAKELFRNISLGVKLDYFFLHQPANYGNRNALTFELGILAKPSDNFKFGIHAYNPIQATYFGYNNEYLPVVLSVGAAYIFSDKFTISAETEKILDISPLIFRLGMEYQSDNGFAIRTGISSYPIKAAFGFGYATEHLSFNFAYSWHQVLGSTPHISLAYAF